MRNRAGQAGRKGDQPLVPLPKQIQIDTGFPVKAVQKRLRDHIAQIFIAPSILAQQDQVIRVIVHAVDPIAHLSPGDINLTANDGLDPGGFGGFVKINTAVHHAMVCNGNGVLPQLLYPVHHPVNPAGTVQETVFCMHVQMNKTHTFSSDASSTSLFSR